MRPSGRAPDQLRKIPLEPGFSRHAEGSCLCGFGDTHVSNTRRPALPVSYSSSVPSIANVRIAEPHQARALGVARKAGFERDLAKLVGGAAGRAHDYSPDTVPGLMGDRGLWPSRPQWTRWPEAPLDWTAAQAVSRRAGPSSRGGGRLP